MTIANQNSPAALLQHLINRTRSAFSTLQSSKPGDTKADEAIFKEIERIEEALLRLDFSFIQKIMNDASLDRDSHEKLEELHKLLDEVEDAKKNATHKEHMLYRKAKEMKRKLKGQAKRAKRSHEHAVKTHEKAIKQLEKQKDKHEEHLKDLKKAA